VIFNVASDLALDEPDEPDDEDEEDEGGCVVVVVVGAFAAPATVANANEVTRAIGTTSADAARNRAIAAEPRARDDVLPCVMADKYLVARAYPTHQGLRQNDVSA
jgi:hypothetical protein